MNQPPAPIDTLYQTYDKGLNRITGEEGMDSIMDIMANDQSGVSTNAAQVETSVSNLGSGTAVVSTDQASGTLKSGQTLFNDGQPGYFLGVQKGIAVLSIGESTSNYLTWDGTSLTIVGTIMASTIIGGTIETAASGQRIVISGADNKLYFYDTSQLIVAIGTTSLYAISITPSSVTNNGISIVSSVAGNAISVSNAGSVQNRALLVSVAGATNSLNAVDITYGGISYGLYVTTAAVPAAALFANVTHASGGNAMLAQSASALNPAVYVINSAGEGMYISSGGTASTLALAGGGPTGSTGILSISGTNAGDGISLTQTANDATNFAIGMHINLTNSGSAAKAAALRIEGDSVVSSGVGGSQDRKIRVLIGSTTYYIPAYTA